MAELDFLGWECSSVAECLPSMCKALGSILSMAKRKKEKKRRKKKWAP
jgi:hypothetical protein